MKLFEFYSAVDNKGELAALSQFLLARADDTGTKKTISVPAFLKLSKDMGISMTRDQLINMIQQPPLNGIIANIEGDEIIFKGSEQPTDTMTVDQAQATVDRMAKRALKKSK